MEQNQYWSHFYRWVDIWFLRCDRRHRQEMTTVVEAIMTTFTFATTVIFASLGIVGLALGLLARRYSLPVLAIGLAGLLALTAASTWITLTWPEFIDQATKELSTQNVQLRNTNVKLNEVNTAATITLTKSHERTNRLDSRIQNLTSERDLIRTKNESTKAAGADLTRQIDKLVLEAARLETKLMEEGTKRAKAEQDVKVAETRLKKRLLIAERKKQEAERLNLDLNTEIEERKKTERLLSEAHDMAKNDGRKLAVLRGKLIKQNTSAIHPQFLRPALDNRLENGCYISRSLPRNELVLGLQGSWYALRLKNRGKPLVFADGQFRIPEAKKEIQECALRFHKEVVVPVAKVAKRIRLFVRGGADTRRIIGQVEDPEVRKITYLPLQQSGRYTRDPKQQAVTVPVRNEDLPNLRADWLRQLIRSALATSGADIKNIGAIDILQNKPGRRHERTADYLLYVEW